MKHVLTLMLLLGAALLLATRPGSAKDLILKEAIASEPVNVVHYLDQQVDYLAEIFKRLTKTGKPVLMFNKEEKAGLEVTLIEDVPKRNFNLIAGLTFGNEEPGEFFWGVEYELTLVGGMWEIFSRFRPAAYLVSGELYWGFSFEFRPEKSQSQ